MHECIARRHWMIFLETGFEGAYVIEPDLKKDFRGYFARTFCSEIFSGKGLRKDMVQSNTSWSEKRYTLRGMHYQKGAAAEAKLIRCIRGKILDVIIDIRPGSDTFGKHLKVELSDDNKRMLYVPEGFAHGYLTMEDNTEVFYQVSNYYDPVNEAGIRWNDPFFGVEWPVQSPVISEKDSNHPNFTY
jgi:dTDP-4-dehydrorhamnose 3,5-epimerase